MCKSYMASILNCKHSPNTNLCSYYVCVTIMIVCACNLCAVRYMWHIHLWDTLPNWIKFTSTSESCLYILPDWIKHHASHVCCLFVSSMSLFHELPIIWLTYIEYKYQCSNFTPAMINWRVVYNDSLSGLGWCWSNDSIWLGLIIRI